MHTRLEGRLALLVRLSALALLLALGGCDGCQSDDEDSPSAEAEDSGDPKDDEADDEDRAAADESDDDDEADEPRNPKDRVAAAKERLEDARRKKRDGEVVDEAKDGDDAVKETGDDARERRRVERERRISELKQRNEERRKERLARVANGGRGDTPAEPEDAPPGRAEPETDKPEADPRGREAAPQPPAADRGASPRGAEPPKPTAKPRKPSPMTPRGPVLDIARFLTVADVRSITNDQTLTPVGGLSGIVPGETYNSTYFAPPARSNFGVSMQVWREKTRRDANERYRRMREQFPNAEDTTSISSKSFFSYWNDIMSVTFTDLTRRTVVSVSCNQAICKPAQLIEMANTVKKRI